MAVPRWRPRHELTKAEDFIVSRLHRTRKLFAFLRRHRDAIFDDAFQDELAAMYRDTGAGTEPLPPALLAMVLLLQAYLKTSDAEAVELALMDRRWQLVLDCAGAEAPVFSQGALEAFRARVIAHEMDLRILQRTADVARASGAFDARKLPTTLRLAVDSRPLVGAGRVEDTVNLLGHAARHVVRTVARLLDWPLERVCTEAGMPLLLAPSLKAGLDVDWSDERAKAAAFQRLDRQLVALERWVTARLPGELRDRDSALARGVATVHQVYDQDVARTADGRFALRDGVAPDRRVSIEDAEMRHGRKSASKRFDGYKQHVATDLDTDLIVAVAITPANRPEAVAAEPLLAEITAHGHEIGTLYIDRGYLASSAVVDVTGAGGRVVCRPWPTRRAGDRHFPKAAFTINVRDQTITCPAGETVDFEFGQTVEFEARGCDACAVRSHCTSVAPGRGRLVQIRTDEPLQKRLRAAVRSRAGRATLRERTSCEHRLAHVAQRQGPRARYRGVRKNLFDLRRVAAIQNLEAWQRAAAAQAMVA